MCSEERVADARENQKLFFELERSEENGVAARRPRVVARKKVVAGEKKSAPENIELAGIVRGGLEGLGARLAQIEGLLYELLSRLDVRNLEKEFYTTVEVAKILTKRPYTVREWCRLGRVHAEKALSGRGIDDEWRISHQELCRIQNEGLLPLGKAGRVRAK